MSHWRFERFDNIESGRDGRRYSRGQCRVGRVENEPRGTARDGGMLDTCPSRK
jgi:hypothetical protein